MGTYASPVDQLLKRGRPEGANDAIDFTALGIGLQHVPDLIRMLGDEELSDKEPACYGQIYAWRALGQLRAPEAIEALLDLLTAQEDDANWSDWVTEDVPTVLGQFGPGAIPPIVARLERRGQQEHAPCYFANALVEVAKRHPETRPVVVNELCRALETAAANNASLNGFIVSDLLDLNASDAWPTIERAFATGNVDESVVGDAEEIKWRLGLGSKPPPRDYQAHLRSQLGLGSPKNMSAKQRFETRQQLKKAEKKRNKKKRK